MSTINLNIELEKEDLEVLIRKAAKAGMRVDDLVTNFIHDMTMSDYGNGMDEKMLAVQWYDEHGFEMMADKDFFHYLTQTDQYEEVISELKRIENGREQIEGYRKRLKYIIKVANKVWQNDSKEDGSSYSSKEDYLEEMQEVYETLIADEDAEIQKSEEVIEETWNSFLEWTSKQNPDKEEELKKVIHWKNYIDELLKEETVSDLPENLITIEIFGGTKRGALLVEELPEEARFVEMTDDEAYEIYAYDKAINGYYLAKKRVSSILNV